VRRTGLLQLVPALALFVGGCADPATITIEVTTGHESDTYSMDPAVTKVDVVALASDGSQLAKATSEPGGSFDIGEVPIDQFLRVEVTGSDADGQVRVRGRSIGLVIGALQGELLPVFAQRLERWSRPPGALTHSHVGGIGGVLGERFLMLTGGSGIDADASAVAFYDLLALGGSVGGSLSLVPKSMIVADDASTVLFIDDDRALSLDFSTGSSFEVELPTGLSSWASIAGGRIVTTPTVTYVVGAARDGEPSDRVLVVAADGGLTTASLTTARAHAAAAWIEDVGLVVAGGDADAAGIEVIADGDSSAKALAYGADSTAGAVAAIGSQSKELLLACGSSSDMVGGSQPAPVRLVDLSCVDSCAPVELAIDLGVSLDACEAFAIDGGRVILTGTDVADGLMRSFAFAITGDSVEELSLRQPRSGGVLVPAPNGSLALLGGAHQDGSAALNVELLYAE